MSDHADILISVRGRFIDSMLAGTKKVELRRRAPRISVGTRIWIYDKAPIASVRAVAILGKSETMQPDALWQQYGSTLALSYKEYVTYVDGCEQATALSLEEIGCVPPVSLNKLRELKPRFHPPQFFLRLDPGGPLVELLELHLSRKHPCHPPANPS